MDLIKPLLNTVLIISALLFTGIILLLFSKKLNLARTLLVTGTLLFFLLSFKPFSIYLLWRLESRYPPVTDSRGYEDAEYIVVLTAWDTDMHTVPHIQNLGYRSALRILEAHRIYTQIPHRKIIISGTRIGGKLMSMLLTQLGVPKKDIALDHSNNTLMSALSINKNLHDKKFFLVTSAIHMPRSMLSFSSQGMKPIPAPSDYLHGYQQEYNLLHTNLSYYLPNTHSFMNSSAALYEYFGLVSYHIKLTGKQ